MSKSPELLLGVESPVFTPLKPFDERVLAFLSALSQALMHAKQAKAYPDITTFAFFCRRASLEHMKADYDERELAERLGRGLCFHIAPSNVPINFAYSLVAALLSGCASIVKASSQDFAQTRIVCAAMRELLDGEFAPLAPYVCVLTYPRDAQELTERYSAACDVRVIWGGDETVRRVRAASIPPRAFDVTFPDRYSLMCISAQAVQKMDEKELARSALGFYNDTYLSDQNACTAPRLIYWVGEGQAIADAQARFWRAVCEYAAPRYAVQPVIAVDKLTQACRMGMELDGAHIEPEGSNLTTRVRVDELPANIDEYRCAGGFFVEYASPTLDALTPVVKRKYQTITYLGVNPAALQAFVHQHGLFGVDRVAPVGHSMDFALVWDGCDLIRSMSRRVTAF